MMRKAIMAAVGRMLGMTEKKTGMHISKEKTDGKGKERTHIRARKYTVNGQKKAKKERKKQGTE